MNKLNVANSLYIGKAEYYFGDGVGNKLLVNVDYKNKKYKIDILISNGEGLKLLKEEAELFVTDLLERKGMVNIAQKS